MKMAKRMFTILMSVLMVLALALPAFAEGTGSITINNATKGKTYTIYKVFDATYTGTGDDALVAYSYTKTGASDALYTALAEDDSPFTLTLTTTANVYNVKLKDGKQASDVANWFKSNAENLTETDHKIADSDTVKFESLAPGYYYVTSELGSTATITSAAPDVIIQDKNQKPGPDPEDSAYKEIVDEDGVPIVGDNTVSYGDTVYFVLKAEATNYDGDKQITSYTAHDILGAGLENLQVTKVEVINNDVTEGNTTVLRDGEYTVVTKHTEGDGDDATTVPEDGCTAEITIPWVTGEGNEADPYVSKFNANSTIKVYCQATVTNTAVVGNTGSDITNQGWFTWLKDDGTTDGGDSQPTTVTSYTYAIGIYKTDSKNNALANAKFTIADKDGTTITVTKESDGVYRYDTSSEETEVVSGSDGKIIVKGLAASGDYTLTETEAPAGYNKLDYTIPVKATKMTASTTTTTIYFDDDGNIVDEVTGNPETIDFDVPVAAVNVVNEAGAQLPSTGGMGTVMFYVLGGVLVVAAGVLLVTKRRMKDDK